MVLKLKDGNLENSYGPAASDRPACGSHPVPGRSPGTWESKGKLNNFLYINSDKRIDVFTGKCYVNKKLL